MLNNLPPSAAERGQNLEYLGRRKEAADAYRQASEMLEELLGAALEGAASRMPYGLEQNTYEKVTCTSVHAT